MEEDIQCYPPVGTRLEITEQPESNVFRFRYKSEGPSHGILKGASSTKDSETQPSVTIVNYTGHAQVVVQLVTDEENPKLHPHSLVGERCQNGICTVPCGPHDMTTRFSFGILQTKKKDVIATLQQRYLASEEQANCGSHLKNMACSKDKNRNNILMKAEKEAQSIDLSVVRLMFIAYLPDANGDFTVKLPPVISDPILNGKNSLRICRMSENCGCAAGNTEIYLLCDTVTKGIEIHVFEENEEGEAVWMEKGRFYQTDIHRQVAIVFRTPPYKHQAITEPVDVWIQLYRPKDREISDAVPFRYVPNKTDSDEIKEKRRKVSPTFTNHLPKNSQKAHGGAARRRSKNRVSYRQNDPQTYQKCPQTAPWDPALLFSRLGTAQVASCYKNAVSTPRQVPDHSTPRQVPSLSQPMQQQFHNQQCNQHERIVATVKGTDLQQQPPPASQASSVQQQPPLVLQGLSVQQQLLLASQSSYVQQQQQPSLASQASSVLQQSPLVLQGSYVQQQQQPPLASQGSSVQQQQLLALQGSYVQQQQQIPLASQGSSFQQQQPLFALQASSVQQQPPLALQASSLQQQQPPLAQQASSVQQQLLLALQASSVQQQQQVPLASRASSVQQQQPPLAPQGSSVQQQLLPASQGSYVQQHQQPPLASQASSVQQQQQPLASQDAFHQQQTSSTLQSASLQHQTQLNSASQDSYFQQQPQVPYLHDTEDSRQCSVDAPFSGQLPARILSMPMDCDAQSTAFNPLLTPQCGRQQAIASPSHNTQPPQMANFSGQQGISRQGTLPLQLNPSSQQAGTSLPLQFTTQSISLSEATGTGCKEDSNVLENFMYSLSSSVTSTFNPDDFLTNPPTANALTSSAGNDDSSFNLSCFYQPSPFGTIQPDQQTDEQTVAPNDHDLASAWGDTFEDRLDQIDAASISSGLRMTAPADADDDIEADCGLPLKIEKMCILDGFDQDGQDKEGVKRKEEHAKRKEEHVKRNEEHVKQNEEQLKQNEATNKKVPCFETNLAQNIQVEFLDEVVPLKGDPPVPPVNQTNIIQTLISQAMESGDDTFVHQAVMFNEMDLITLLNVVKTFGNSTEILNSRNQQKQTALQIATLMGNINAVESLLRAGACPLVVDKNGNHSIHVASRRGNAGILKKILSSLSITERRCDTTNNKGMGCYHLAAKAKGDGSQCMRLLKQHHFNVDMREVSSGRTALHVVAKHNSLDRALCLIAECDADIEATTYDGYTPLHIAAATDSHEVASLLLACGADPEAKSFLPSSEDEIAAKPMDLTRSQRMREMLKGKIFFPDGSCGAFTSLNPSYQNQLCDLLNVDKIGYNWFALVNCLQLTTLETTLDDSNNPTYSLLRCYEAWNGSVNRFRSALMDIRRHDALQVFNRALQPCSECQTHWNIPSFDSNPKPEGVESM